MRAVFQPVTAEGLDQVVGFMERLYGGESIPFELGRARRAAEWLLAHPDAGGIWRIEAAGKMAGYLVVTVCVSLEFQGPFALLDELFVEAAWRGCGLGEQAVEFAARWARERGMAALRLEVGHENAAALGLYRKCGFVDQGRIFLTRWL